MKEMSRHPALAIILALAPAVPAQRAPQPGASSQLSTQTKPAVLGSGEITNGVYRNVFFGFSCKVPFGWVDRTQDLQKGSEAGKSRVLLAVFERPPEAPSETVNSAVVIAAESVSSYPGLKGAADYFGPLTELTATKGFKVVNEPYAFQVGAKTMVRGDFRKELSKLTVNQGSLVIVQEGYIVSFNFIGGSDEEVEELIENLSFAAAQKPATARPKK